MPRNSQFEELGTRVLVVDDDPVISTIVARLLRSAGYSPAAVQSPEEASQLASDFLPDLIISDLRMPDLDGRELCARLKGLAATRHIPVVILSGYGDPGNRNNAKSAGAAAFLGKPFDSSKLLETIRVVLEAHSCE